MLAWQEKVNFNQNSRVAIKLYLAGETMPKNSRKSGWMLGEKEALRTKDAV
jgi:hypothetical protein